MADESLRPPPPTKPSLTRPAVEFPEQPRFDGSLTVGSFPSGTERRHVLSPNERETLMGLGRRTVEGRGAPAMLVKQLANAGLVDLAVTAGGWSVTMTAFGQEALQRGWYPLPDDVG